MTLNLGLKIDYIKYIYVSIYNEIIYKIVKKHYINIKNYFIQRVNYNNNMVYLKIIYIITKHFSVKKNRLEYYTSRIHTI